MNHNLTIEKRLAEELPNNRSLNRPITAAKRGSKSPPPMDYGRPTTTMVMTKQHLSATARSPRASPKRYFLNSPRSPKPNAG